jgi:menaquinone-dependent protoporphyrinogen IX oxidase
MSIFQTAQDPAASGQTALTDLVGEGKKFKTPDDLAKAKLESDRFIEKLQNEQRELREELSKRLSAEEALRRAQEAGSRVEQGATTPQTPPPQRTQEQPADIMSEVEKALNRRDQQKTVQSNMDQVTSKMTSTYGSVEKAAEVVQQKAQELGMSMTKLQELASENPKAFFTLLGVNDKAPEAPKTSSWANTKNAAAMKSGAAASMVNPGTYKYYEEIRKSDPAAYFSPRVQLQMDKDAREKGDKFFS